MAGREYQLMFRMNAAVNGGFAAAFSGATSSLAQLQSKISALNKTQNQINQYARQEQAIQRTASKLEMLRQQYANLSEEMERNGDTSADSMNKLLEKQNKIEDLTRALERQQAQYQATGEALRESGVDVGNLSGEAERVSQELAEATQAQEEFTAASQETAEGANGAAESLTNLAAAAGAMEVMKKGVEILKECVKASIEFESAMTGVAKTTDLSAQEYADISRALKDMSTEMPITTTELAGIMETAGQLGIAKEGLVDFTRVMAELGTATNMTSEEAATMLAQFAFVTDMDASKYNNLGSAIVALGNNFATTEKNVTEMAQGIAGIASQAGMTQPQILGIAAAVTSLGEESATGATSMQKVISTLQTAVETGDGLERIASVAGLTADQFRRAWAEDAAGAMQAFIAGLNDVERNGMSASMVLQELGMNDARLMRMMLSLANSSTSLSSAIQMANEAWSQGTALATEAATRYGTVESQLQIASNAFNNLKVAIGDAFMPIVAQAAGLATDIMKPVTSFIEQNPRLVQAVAAAAGVIGAVTVALTGYAAAASVAAKVSAAFLAVVPGGKLILGITAAVAALVAGVVLLSNAYAENQKSMADLNKEYDDLMGQYQKTREIQDTIQQYRDLKNELDGTTESAVRLNEAGDIEIILNATADATVVPGDFMVDGNTMIQLTAGQTADLLASGFLSSDDPGIQITAQQTKDLLESGFLSPNDPGIMLTAEQTADLLKSGFLSPNDTGIILTAEQTADLLKTGFLSPSDPGITISAGQTAELLKSGFLAPDDPGITLTAEQKASLVAAGFLSPDDPGLTLTAQQTADLVASGFLNPSDPGITLTAQQTADLVASGFLSGSDPGITLTAQQTADLLASGFLDASDPGIILSAQQTASLLETGFLDPSDPGIILTAEQAATLIQSGFLSPDDPGIKVTAEQVQSLMAAGFLKDGDTVALIPTVGATLSKYGFFTEGADGTIKFTIKLDNLEQIKKDLEAVQTEYTQAKSMLDSMQQRYSELAARLKYSTDDKTKKTIAEEMSALSEEIDKKKTEVDELQSKYNALATAYQTASNAAESLKNKEQERVEIMNQLRESSNGIITATNEETEAFEKQLDVVEKINEAKQIEIRSQAVDNLKQQAGQYARSLIQESEARERLSEAAEKQGRVMEMTAQGADELASRFGAIIERLMEISDESGTIDWGSDEVKALRVEAEEIASIMQGGKAVNYQGTGLSGMIADMEMVGVTASGMESAVKEAGSEVREYAEDVEEATQIQQTFIDNVVDMVTSGGMGIEQARALLEEQFAGYANGGAIVEEVMNRVTQAIHGAEEAAAAAAGNAGASAADVENTLKPMIEYMEELGKAYDEVYKSAYASINGQLSLFGEAPKIEEKSVSQMVKNLKDQKKYLDEYVANLNAVKEMGLNEAIIAQLSDGSAESASYLNEIVKNGQGAIDELNTAYAGVEEGKKTFSETVAEMQTDFSSKMEEMEGIVKSTVENMDLSGEAAAAAQSTMQAFADGASGMTETVKNAFAKVASAAAAALVVKPGSIGGGDGGSGGATVGAKATGTPNAPRGFSMVGEQGPELVYFHGGEQVLNARETSKALMGLGSGGGVSIMVEPIYNITGTGANTELREILYEQNANLRATIEDILSDIESDRARSVYS